MKLAEIDNNQQAAGITGSSATAVDRPELAAPQEKTKGEKLFDKILYGGVGYGVNFVLSVIGAHYFLKGKGQKFHTAMHDGLEAGAKVIMPKKMASKFTGEMTRIISLGMGGNLAMIPVKMLEDRKQRLTYWLNCKFFPSEYEGKIPLKPLSEMKDDDLPDVVEEPSKMSWAKTGVRRLIIYVGVAAALAPFAKVNHWVEAKIKSGVHKGLKNAHTMTGAKVFEKIERSKKLQEYLDVGTSDIYASAIAAVMIKMTNGAHGFFAGFRKKRKAAKEKMEREKEAELAATVAAMETSGQPIYTNMIEPRVTLIEPKVANASYAEAIATQRDEVAAQSQMVTA